MNASPVLMLAKPKTPTVLLVLAAVLGVHALWVLISEAARPRIDTDARFPVALADPDGISARRAARIAAHIGLVRGDLWADYVLIEAARLIGTGEISRDELRQIRRAAERALANAPIDARVWLVLAMVSDRLGEPSRQTRARLMMSYYTGPNDQSLMGYRLLFSTRIGAADDEELREAARREIRTILLRLPALRPVIVAAFNEASPRGRQFIESVVTEIDPAFLPVLRKQP